MAKNVWPYDLAEFIYNHIQPVSVSVDLFYKQESLDFLTLSFLSNVTASPEQYS